MPILTLVTYESPAAQHMIDDWCKVEAVNGRLRTWSAISDGCAIAEMQSGEQLYIIPLTEEGTRQKLDKSVSWARDILGDHVAHLFHKMLHFGKVPTRSLRWLTVQRLVAPSGGEA